jgi:DNA repair protein RadC
LALPLNLIQEGIMSLYKKYLVKIHMVREKTARPLVNTPDAVIALVRKELEKYDREYLVCIYLDTSMRVVAVE